MHQVGLVTFDTGRVDEEGKPVIVKRVFIPQRIRYDNEFLKTLEAVGKSELAADSECQKCDHLPSGIVVTRNIFDSRLSFSTGILGLDFRGTPIFCDCLRKPDETNNEKGE